MVWLCLPEEHESKQQSEAARNVRDSNFSAGCEALPGVPWTCLTPGLDFSWTWGGKKVGEDIPASRSMNNPNVSLTGLFSWFSFLQLVLINQGAKETRLQHWPFGHPAGAKPPAPYSLIPVFFCDSSFIFSGWSGRSPNPWILPLARTSSVFREKQTSTLGFESLSTAVAHRCRTHSRSQKRSRDPHPPSFLTQKQ